MDSKNIFENPFGNIFEKVSAQEADAVVSPTLPVDPNLQGPLFGEIPEPTETITGRINAKANNNTERILFLNLFIYSCILS